MRSPRSPSTRAAHRARGGRHPLGRRGPARLGAGAGRAARLDPDVSVACYTAGGGVGWYGRALGLAAGSVTAIELVTADRRLRPRRGVRLTGRLIAVDGDIVSLTCGDRQQVDAVVWATGYRPDYSWLPAVAVGADGWPLHRRGVSPVPGLGGAGPALVTHPGFGARRVGGPARELARRAARLSPRATGWTGAGWSAENRRPAPPQAFVAPSSFDSSARSSRCPRSPRISVTCSSMPSIV